MRNFLEQVAETVLKERFESKNLLREWKAKAADVQNRSAFTSEFKPGGMNIIAEIKFASPSEGTIWPFESGIPAKIAADYLQNGAQALSILTEPFWFKGDGAYIQSVRSALPEAKILMKDFYLTETQFYQAKALGANAVLLIAAMLSDSQYREFHDLALSLGLTPLTEIHTLEELERVLPVAVLPGINNRNLKTLQTDLNTGLELRKHVPLSQRCVCESGIDSEISLKQMKAGGFDTFLIGTSLMRSGTPGAKLSRLLAGVRS